MNDAIQAIEQLAQCDGKERRLLISWDKQTGWNATLSGARTGKVLGSARHRATAEEAILAAIPKIAKLTIAEIRCCCNCAKQLAADENMYCKKCKRERWPDRR